MGIGPNCTRWMVRRLLDGAERESISPQAHTSDQETESPHKSASSRGDAWGSVNST